MSIKQYQNLNLDQVCEESYLKNKQAHNVLNHCVTLVDVKQQLKEAKAGKLYKIPYALKDNISTKGILTTACSNILDNYVAPYDATVYQKLKEAGAILVAKTSMDELAMGGSNKTANIGPCLNPYDLNCISGGSSGGSAVSVAANLVPFALGTDTGDSIRKPASFCGIVGVKPSYGRISRYGVIPYASSLDHVGYFCQNVYDASVLLEVLAGRDDKDLTSNTKPVLEYSKLLESDIKDKKILVFKNVLDALDPSSSAYQAFYQIVNQLKEKGATIKEVSFDQDLMRALFPTYYIIANCEATANHANLDGLRFGHQVSGSDIFEIIKNTRSQGFGTFVKKRFLVGSYGLYQENQEAVLRKAQKVRRKIVEAVLAELKDYDCLIAPASAKGALGLNEVCDDTLSDQYLIVENHMVIGNFAGLPSMTIPMGYDSHMPLGINITCNAFDEVGMFQIAQIIEDITGLKDLKKEVVHGL